MTETEVKSKGLNRSSGVVTVRQDDNLSTAGEKMRKHEVGCVVVVDDEKKLVGILSERDVIVNVMASDKVPARMEVREVMTPDVHSCPPGTHIGEIQRIMDENHIRHVPIVEDGRPVGMVSAREVLRYNRNRQADMRGAAEQVAGMFASLRSVDFEELVNLITYEVPHMLGAERSVLCFKEAYAHQRDSFQIHRSSCQCPYGELVEHARSLKHNRSCLTFGQDAPDTCLKNKTCGDNVVVPLGVSTIKTHDNEESSPVEDYLCMCEFRDSNGNDDELFEYKLSLLEEALSVHLANAKLFEKYQIARRESLQDVLTGLGTRRLMEIKLREECDRSARYATHFSLVIIDVDNFKYINDHFGHVAGDRVLVSMAKALESETRRTDTACRYGGDEFVLIMPETDVYQAETVLKRIRNRIHDIDILNVPGLKVSCGLAGLDGSENVSAAKLLRRADAALHLAKRNGGDQATCWDDLSHHFRQCMLEEGQN